MKTATITFHSPNNNGSFLQAYALQRVLIDKLGVENDIIDFRTDKQIQMYSVLRPACSIRDLIKNGIGLLHYSQLCERNNCFETMRKRYLNMTEQCGSVNQVSIIANRYDTVIVGSDQIWNTEAPDFSEAYVLPNVYANKVAYAVSLGSYSAESKLKKYIPSLQKFSKISVREQTAKNYIEKEFEISVEISVDPTLLLDKEEYLVLAKDKRVIEGEYIFFYSISYPTEVLLTVVKIAKQMGLRIVTVFTSFHTIKCEMYGIEIMYREGPDGFLNLLMNAKAVFTNSFHGTAFSIILNKPFLHICETVDGRMLRDDRIDDLIDELGIEGCNISSKDLLVELPDIDWIVVNEKCDEIRNKAYEYLQSPLK